jgi:hypothetical protein
MPIPFLSRVRWLALYVLALAAWLHIEGCKDNGSSGMANDGGPTFSCGETGHDHSADHNADNDGGSAPDHDAEQVGPPSGATCPSNNTLTYDNFGKQFMTTYCTRCHSSKLTTCNERMGAPFEHDFDTYAGIVAVANHIDEMAAAGPKSTNVTMPLNGKKPTTDERKKLGQWLACEQDKLSH